MKTVLILRHGKSSWKEPELADHDRPLNKRGRQDAPRMGRLLDELGLVPDWIVSSTATRAETTAAQVAAASGYGGDIQLARELYHAGAETLLDALRGLSENCRRVLLVGHNPGLEDFLEMLTGTRQTLPTAALAQVDLQIDRWQDVQLNGGGTLVHIWRPREIA